MKKFIRFTVQKYMSMYPETEIQLFEVDRVEAAITQMNNNWSGGVYYTEYHVMTLDEARDYAMSLLEIVDNNPDCNSQKVKDNIRELFMEGYSSEL